LIAGALPRHGPAHGTLSVTLHMGTLNDPEAGKFYFGDCVTGVLSWSAERQ
jgi:hypothetical protein